MILRPAEAGDIDYFYLLRCDPVASMMSRRRAPTWDEHMDWWTRTTDHRIVAEVNGAYAGTLRISSDGMISVIVDPTLRGMGIGSEMLSQVQPIARQLGFTVLHAEIAPENTASQRAFAKAGWKPILFEVHL